MYNYLKSNFEYIKILPLLILILTICSCGSKKSKFNKKTNNEIAKHTEQLTNKYNIKYKLDTLDWKYYNYTIDFEPIIDSKIQLLDNIYIIDIYSKDSINHVTLTCGYLPTFYLDFPIDENQKNILKEHDNYFLMAVKIKKIKKQKIRIISGIEEDESYIDTDISDDFIGEGEIIEIISIKTEN